MNMHKAIAFGLGVALASPLLVLADDVEVYTGRDLSSGARPNVVFIIDTSRNMVYGPNRMQTQKEYDPEYTYVGNCERDRLYFVSSATKATHFSESFRWDASATPDDDGCADRYPFYPLKTQARTATDPQPLPVHEDVDTVTCLAAQEPLKTQGWYEDDFRYALRWSVYNAFFWTPGLNDDDYSTLAEMYRCAGDSGPMSGTQRFFVFTGNYLNWYFNDRETRLAVAQRGIKKMIDRLPNGGVNVGLMPFAENSLGARVLYPARDINGNQTTLKAAIDTLTGDVGKRALAGSLFEAYNYFAGNKPVIGDWNVPESVPESWLADRSGYNTPADLSCQSNHIVLITDGEPDENASSVIASYINGLPDFTSLVGSCADSLGADCAKKLALYMNKRDVVPDITGNQFVNVHAIGLGLSTTQPFFMDLVAAGGGEYLVAEDAENLAEVVSRLFESAIVVNGTFVAPAVSVNAFNRSRHRNELYFAVFEVGQKYRWNGNLKKYQVAELADGSFAVVDVNGVPALDAATGEFAATAKSWWSATPDGNDPVLGGANARLAEWVELSIPRKFYTNVAPGAELLVSGNALSATNTNITAAHTNAPDEATSDAWLNSLYAGDMRSKYGDPLHSQPVVVNYGGTESNPDAVAYFTTNDGMLHAVHPGNATAADINGGYELFGFMPREMLSKVGSLVGTGIRSKGYGLDSSVVPWVKDEGTAGTISGGDHVYLYFGAGRGGRLYYGLDATSYSAPKMLWTGPVTGGVPGEFAELGYTTAEPVLARIRRGGVDRDVLVIAGGYDPDYDILPNDEDAVDSGEDMGRAIYFVDAHTGVPVWHGGRTGADDVFADMNYPIAAAPRVLDMNGDGYADRLYVGDLGGQLWRFDIDASGNVDGGVIARLGSGLSVGEGARARRFFSTPDVVLINSGDQAPYLAINIGSGNRSRPVADTFTQDIFFSIRDPFVSDTPDSYALDYGITASSAGGLVDVTGVADPVIPADAKGWYLRLRADEKVLAESLTFDNKLMFTTYQPDSDIGANSCTPNLGTGRVYAVDVRDATAVVDADGNGTMDAGDRDQELDRTGIPPEVVVLFPDAADGAAVPFVGPEVPNIPLGKTQYRTYWTDDVNEE